MESIIIGSDHAGFTLKESIKTFLNILGYSVTDVGTYTMEPVDYPEFGVKVAEPVSSGKFSRGILVCGSGVGMTIIANKFPNVRAALCLDEETARLSRLHNNTNLLVLAGRRTDTETGKAIVQTWLMTEFEGGRHQRRLEKIKEIESRLFVEPTQRT